MKKVLFAVISLFLTLVCAAQQRDEYITVNDIRRHFVSYVPASKTDNPAVIISLHGRLSNGKGMMRFADFRPIADKEGFIIICPDGINKSWNDGRNTPAYKQGINDVKFINELIDYAVNIYHADAKRVYVTGMSNGGFMASRLACELPGRIAAIAVVAASMDTNAGYLPCKPLPVMYIQGNEDPVVPFSGGAMKNGKGTIYGHEQVLQVWAAADQCALQPASTNLNAAVNDGTGVTRETYSSPSGKVKVTGYIITGGGHTWPGGSQYLPEFLVGIASKNLDACKVIWEFFKQSSVAD